MAVAYLATELPGTIEEVTLDGRGLRVRLDTGEEVVFRLSRATGRFMSEGAQTGARLRFVDG